MGILNEQEEQFHPATELIRKGCVGTGGAGTDEKSLVKGFQLIKSQADYEKVGKELAQYMPKYKTLIDALNGELGNDDLVYAQQIQTSLKAAGVNLLFSVGKYTTNDSYLIEDSFKLGQAAAAAKSAVSTSGWWDKHPGILKLMKDTSVVKLVHYPPAASKDTGALMMERANANFFWDFFPNGVFYIFDDANKSLSAANGTWKFSGTWKEKGDVLTLSTKEDGESWNSTTKKWAKPAAAAAPKLQYTKNNGFPLMYLQMTEPAPNGIIGKMQVALGLKGDGYFGAVTEKAVKAANYLYTRETGVTQDLYNKIIEGYRYTSPEDVQKQQQSQQPAAASTQPAATPPTDAELQASPNTLNPY